MPATPYALAQVSISGGGVVTGAQSVASAATLQLSPQSTVGWTTAPLWEIYDYPPGFATPAGWTLQASGIITSTAQTPPIINLPANTGVLFGKYAFRLTSNGNNDPNNPNQVDTTLIVKMKSVHNINTVAYGEGSQFGGAQRQWLLDLNADLRAIETALAGGGGSVPTGSGIPHITAGATDVAAIHGTAAGQVLAVNAGITDVAFVAVSGDATLSAAGVINVSAITGASGAGTKVALGTSPVAFALQFVAGVTAPSMGQDANTTDLPCVNFTTRPQAPFAIATGTNRKGGDWLVDVAIPTNGLSTIAGESALTVSRGGTAKVRIGPWTGGAYGSIWFGGNAVAPTAANYGFLGDATTTFVNGVSTLYLKINDGAHTELGSTYLNIASGITPYFGGAHTAATSFHYFDSASTATYHFGVSATSATIQYDAMTVTGAGNLFRIKGQDAFATSGSAGGPMALIGGFGDGAGLAGAIRLQIKAANTTVLECAEVVSGNRVLALGLLANLTSTQMPANTGDGVVFLANRAIVPSANSVGGGIIYCEAGALKYRGTSGTITQLGAA